jgi:hypothetical protein
MKQIRQIFKKLLILQLKTTNFEVFSLIGSLPPANEKLISVPHVDEIRHDELIINTSFLPDLNFHNQTLYTMKAILNPVGKFLFFLSVILLSQANSFAQKKQYQISCVGFYNLENLFDTIDDPEKRDEEYTPEGKKKWNEEKYQDKLFNMAHVISLIGKDGCKEGISVLGVCEIENRKVMEDLVKQPALADRNLQIVHHSSPDKRGIDVGLLYNPDKFELIESKSFRLNAFKETGDTLFTRDQLLVTGLLNKERIHVIVNHWPSRAGGEKVSRPNRNKAAQLCRSIADSITKSEPNAKIFIMGDLNDDPTNDSVKKFIKTKANKKQMKEGFFYNPWENMLKKGFGTLAYRDSWNLFDQILISNPLVDKTTEGYHLYQAKIFRKKFMVQADGRYKGYPKRTFSFGKYNSGYSDHFPTYVYLVKEIR